MTSPNQFDHMTPLFRVDTVSAYSFANIGPFVPICETSIGFSRCIYGCIKAYHVINAAENGPKSPFCLLTWRSTRVLVTRERM